MDLWYSLIWLYGIMVRIEQDGRLQWIEIFIVCPNIVQEAMPADAFAAKKIFDKARAVSCSSLLKEGVAINCFSNSMLLVVAYVYRRYS